MGGFGRGVFAKEKWKDKWEVACIYEVEEKKEGKGGGGWTNRPCGALPSRHDR